MILCPCFGTHLKLSPPVRTQYLQQSVGICASLALDVFRTYTGRLFRHWPPKSLIII